MPTRKKPTSNGGVKILGGFAPLALALLVGNSVLPSAKKPELVKNFETSSAPAVCEEPPTDYQECHSEYPTGCSAAGRYDGYLNLLKNSIAQPKATAAATYLTEADFSNLERSTPKELSKNNHGDLKDDLAKLGEGQTVGIVGYLYYAKATGAESSNCGLTAPDDVDYHIGIGFDPKVAAIATKKMTAAEKAQLTQDSVIVEMTPHYRGTFQPNWTLDALKAVIGRQVRVEGQLLIDSEHYVGSQDCGITGSDKSKCWRASAWELHPVTKFQVCTAESCENNSSEWAELDEAQAVTTVAASKKPKSKP
jgi:hypothetical protein